MNRLSEGFILYLDPVSGETVIHPQVSTYMPNLIRGPYIDEDGEYYLQMVRIWPTESDDLSAAQQKQEQEE